VVVAAAAVQRERQPGQTHGLRAVDDVLDAPFFSDDATFTIQAVIAIEPGGDDLITASIGQQVASELFGGELVEGLVAR